MPRPYLPRLVPKPRVHESFRLDGAANKVIARLVDFKELDRQTVESINRVVNCYRATQSGSASTTVANTLFALSQLKKRGRAREESLKLLAATFYSRWRRMFSMGGVALVRLLHAQHPRVSASTEAMRLFCGELRQIFNDCTPHLRSRITPEEAWHRCRRFALEVFSAAGITHADFDAHPERLTEYLKTDVSGGEPPACRRYLPPAAAALSSARLRIFERSTCPVGSFVDVLSTPRHLRAA